jgi:uncharacterized membrane protein YfcA
MTSKLAALRRKAEGKVVAEPVMLEFGIESRTAIATNMFALTFMSIGGTLPFIGFSGGYVTLLTAAYVMLFRMTFVEAIATTKFINIVSSFIATLIFIKQGIVDYNLGIILGIAMFIGGIIGGRLALKLSNVWLQRIYLTVVAILAFITLRKSQQQNNPASTIDLWRFPAGRYA